MKGKGNLSFFSVKGLKRANSTGFVNHLHSKYSEFTVVKRSMAFCCGQNIQIAKCYSKSKILVEMYV